MPGLKFLSPGIFLWRNQMFRKIAVEPNGTIKEYKTDGTVVVYTRDKSYPGGKDVKPYWRPMYVPSDSSKYFTN